MLMSGPFLTGYTQTINDWYDREIDAINEPYRPIPSGAISENEVITQIWVLLLGGLALGGLLDVWLKQNGWIGNFALGSSYISLPWYAALYSTICVFFRWGEEALASEGLSNVKCFLITKLSKIIRVKSPTLKI
nr:chlorophyll synthase, chloroplastic [Ipomoea batatas]